MRRDRLAHGWSMTELAKHTGIHGAHLGRIERRVAAAERAGSRRTRQGISERRGWYLQCLMTSGSAPEFPATFRSWSDYEDNSATLRLWTP